MAGKYDADVQKLYVAYFNRPADPLGLLYWNEQIANNAGSVAAVANAFSASAEYKALYAGKTTAQIIDTIYTNLFGRVAEPSGIEYWGTRLDNGTFNIGTIAYSVYVGAQNADKTAIESKATAAAAFTTALDTNAEIVGYAGSAANAIAKTWLTGVTSAATLATAQASLATTITSAITAGSSSSGSTFTLTTGVDALTGTSDNDIFTGVVGAGATLSAVDSVNGGSGTDTLKIFTDAGIVLPNTMTSIEKLLINDTGAHQNVTLSAAAYVSAGTTELTLQNGTSIDGGTVTVTLGAGQSKLTLDGIVDADTANATAGDGDIVVATLATTATVAGTASLDLSLNNMGATGANSAQQIDTSTAALTTLNVTATGTNFVHLLNSGAGLTKLNIAGDGKLTSYNALATGIKTIDASTATGNLQLDVSGSSVRTVTGGKGNDTFIFGANYIGAEATDKTTVDTVNGGEGTDTVSMTVARVVAASAAAQTNLTSVEGLTISDEWTTGLALDVSKFADVTTVTLGDTTKSASGTSTMTVKSGTTVTLAADTHTDAVTTFAIGGTGTADTLTIKTQGFDWKTGGTAKLATTGVETLTLDTGLSAAGTAVIDGTTAMTPSAGGTAKIVVQGDGAMTFTGVVTASEIDASALKGILTVTGTAANAITIKGGTKADVINGSASNDLITGNDGADQITAGAGNDSINLTETTSAVDTVFFSGGAATNALTLAANGFDTITGFGTNDIINIKALGNNTQAGGTVTIAAPAAKAAFTDGGNYIINTAATAGALTTGGTAVVTDYTSMTQVAAFLSERFSHTANTADEEMVVVWNVGTTTYVYNVDSKNTVNTTIDADEISLVGQITQTAALTSANISVA